MGWKTSRQSFWLVAGLGDHSQRSTKVATFLSFPKIKQQGQEIELQLTISAKRHHSANPGRRKNPDRIAPFPLSLSRHDPIDHSYCKELLIMVLEHITSMKLKPVKIDNDKSYYSQNKCVEFIKFQETSFWIKFVAFLQGLSFSKSYSNICSYSFY